MGNNRIFIVQGGDFNWNKFDIIKTTEVAPTKFGMWGVWTMRNWIVMSAQLPDFSALRYT